jgi:hypothetical protein
MICSMLIKWSLWSLATKSKQEISNNMNLQNKHHVDKEMSDFPKRRSNSDATLKNIIEHKLVSLSRVTNFFLSLMV